MKLDKVQDPRDITIAKKIKANLVCLEEIKSH